MYFTFTFSTRKFHRVHFFDFSNDYPAPIIPINIKTLKLI